MGLKENFYQALRELLNGGKLVDSDSDNKATSYSDLDSFIEKPRNSSAQDKSEYSSKDFSDFNINFDEDESSGNDSEPDYPPSLEDFTGDNAETERSEQTSKSNIFGRSNRPNIFSKPSRPIQSGRVEYGQDNQPGTPNEFGQTDSFVSTRPAEETTIISKSTVILGDIHSLANVTIDGNVRGKVNVLKDATVRGALVGDLTCNNSNMKGSSVQGNVTAKGSTYIDNDSILLGDMKAQFSNINGKVKGNIEIGSRIRLNQNAIVSGNINTNTIMIEDGANIKGFVNTGFLDENGDNTFPSQVIIDNDMPNS